MDWFGQSGVMQIRRATPTDAAAVAVVHVRSWQAAYQRQLPQDYLDSLDPGPRSEGWARILAAAERQRVGMLVVEADEGVVGFAHCCPTRDEDGHPEVVGEIAALYLSPAVWGRGFGRRLMDESLRMMAESGYREATLWVLGTNERARHFYESGGWRTDGAVKQVRLQGFPLGEVRYRHPLS